MMDSTIRAGALPRMQLVPTMDGFSVAVNVAGPQSGTVVVMLGARKKFRAYNALCCRLHTAMLRTIVVETTAQLNPKSVLAVLDGFAVSSAVLVGGTAGGDLAWTLAATHQQRFNGLVAINCGHPRVPDLTGVIRDERCPPVEIDTTMLVDTSRRKLAKATGRYVYGDFRVAHLLDGRYDRHAAAQVVTEIVLRATAC